MKHFLILLVVMLVGYTAWRSITPAEREATRLFLGTHLGWLLLIVSTLIGLLVTMFSGAAINIL